MNPIIRSILAIVLGLVVGSAINMGIIMISTSVIPPPEGVDITTMEGLVENMHLMQPINFLMPFLAHAFGTLAGATVAALIATNQKIKFAMAIAVLFLIGGTINVFMLPSPLWFNVVDLLGAYVPMGWLGWRLASK